MPGSESRGSVDWRAWVVVVWVAWFGVRYGLNMVESRGAKIRAAVGASWSSVRSMSPSGQTRTAPPLDDRERVIFVPVDID